LLYPSGSFLREPGWGFAVFSAFKNLSPAKGLTANNFIVERHSQNKSKTGQSNKFQKKLDSNPNGIWILHIKSH
jgi:hypothetical protein